MTTTVRPRQRVGRIKAAFDSPAGLRRGMNLWLPFLATGIRILEVSEGFDRVVVRLRRSRLTSNYVGTVFGGSLFAMTDPFWMIMMMRRLVVAPDGTLVARVRKQLYVRRSAPSGRA